jgi:hypothetical protein
LQRHRADLCLGRRRFEIMKHLDVSTHVQFTLSGNLVPSIKLI